MLFMNPYLNFPGQAEEAFNFYRSIFGGEFSSLVRFKGMPGSDSMSAEEQEKIMHIALPLAVDRLLMGSDVPKSMGQEVKPGNNVNILVQAETREEADYLFQGLSKGGIIEMPIEDMFWGDYFGSFRDRFGIQWMIAFTTKK